MLPSIDLLRKGDAIALPEEVTSVRELSVPMLESLPLPVSLNTFHVCES